MENLHNLLGMLDSKKLICKIPSYWDGLGYSGGESRGYIEVDLCDMLRSCITNCFLNAQQTELPDDKRDFVIYSMLIRSSAAYLTEGNRVEGGTFLKAMLQLPRLKQMGVNMLYLLPVFECSPLYMKGGAPSPYAVFDYMKLNPDLHDDILGKYSADLLNLEFKAFIEACHSLGIRVALDFVFRTIARQTALIKDHPDWFYWLKAQHAQGFRAPKVRLIAGQKAITKKNVHKVYKCIPREYFDKFSPNPKDLDAALWGKIKGSDNVLSEIEKHFGITTAPAFSDYVNDKQPPWTDVTYLRYEMAQNPNKATDVPFALFDTVKLNVFPPNKPNTGLYEYITGIIPFYQDMGIDGARIDMAHALPTHLLDAIRNKAKEKDPGFILWSEEFNACFSQYASDSGFEMISGKTWHYFPKINKHGIWRDMIGELLISKLPVTACLETPDSPRIAFKYKNENILRLMHTICALLPNCALFINTGQELGEIQPMNLGLDNTEKGRFVLPSDDPMYGRLAFFDEYALHYDNGAFLNQCIADAVGLRKKYSRFIRQGKCSHWKKRGLLFLSYGIESESVCFVFNLHARKKRFRVSALSDNRFTIPGHSGCVIRTDGSFIHI